LRVAIFSDLFYPYLLGGGENRYFEVAKHLASRGDEVKLITTSLQGQQKCQEVSNGRIKIFRLGLPHHPITYRALLPIAGYVFSSALNHSLVQDCDLFDLNTYASALVGKFIAFSKKKPCVITFHDVFTPRWLVRHRFYLATLGTLAENALAQIHKHGHFITVSKATRDKMVRFLKIPPDRIHVIPNGVDFQNISKIAREKDSAKEDKRIIYVGRLIAYKNVDHVIHAVKKLRNRGVKVVADIVGEGVERKRLETLASSLGISQSVTFHGFILDR